MKRGYPKGLWDVYLRMDKIYLEYGLRWRDIPKPTIAMLFNVTVYRTHHGCGCFPGRIDKYDKTVMATSMVFDIPDSCPNPLVMT